ncbi:MAG TPA: hypothetical protein VJT70_02480 [Sphingomicrobium sp.]|nr:hypothetical protein [Sphingomicrobium sp.]
MHSSTSPSERGLTGTRDGALPPGLRKTAADRPGQAQPVPTRDIPTRPWVGIGAFVFAAVTLLTAAWEWNARANIGLRAGDIDDSPQAWAEQRRLANRSPVTIVGDSRILFDTDLDRFEQLTGVRPVQTSIVGTNARALLESYANDPDFRGLLILGMAELSYFRPQGVGIGGSYLKNFEKNDKPSQLTGLWLDRWLQRHVAFMDSDYRLSKLVPRFDRGMRPKTYGPYEDVWKISETFPGRQYFMWDKIETDAYLRAHARHAWNVFKGPPLPPFIARNVIARSAEAVRRIRARGGEVIFIRPPSAAELRAIEDKRLPRSTGWDRLLATAQARGIHSDDLPQAQKLVIPEWSHLSRKCATVFTDAYVRRLTELTPRLKLRPNAPPPLSRADCVPQNIASL